MHISSDIIIGCNARFKDDEGLDNFGPNRMQNAEAVSLTDSMRLEAVGQPVGWALEISKRIFISPAVFIFLYQCQPVGL